MIIEAISLAAVAVSAVAVTGGYAEYQRLRRGYRAIATELCAVKYDLAVETQTSEALARMIKGRDATIALQQAEIEKWARARSAIAKAGGIARALKAKQKRGPAMETTIRELAAASLRPRAEVVAGVAEQRAAKKSSGAVAP